MWRKKTGVGESLPILRCLHWRELEARSLPSLAAKPSKIPIEWTSFRFYFLVSECWEQILTNIDNILESACPSLAAPATVAVSFTTILSSMGRSLVALRLVHLEPRSHHRYHRMEGDLIKYIWFFQRMRLGGVTVTAICTSRHLLRNHAFITISSQASKSLFLPPKMPWVACCTVPILVRGKSAMMTPKWLQNGAGARCTSL